MRRTVTVTGALTMVLGFLGAIVLSSLVPAPTAVPVAVGSLLLVPVGFGLLWESLVTWPRDGSPYPRRRRVAGLVVAAALIAVVVATHAIVLALLPVAWWAAVLAQATAVVVAVAVFRRLWPARARRAAPGQKTGAGSGS